MTKQTVTFRVLLARRVSAAWLLNAKMNKLFMEREKDWLAIPHGDFRRMDEEEAGWGMVEFLDKIERQ